jgi:hypothetical protein
MRAFASIAPTIWTSETGREWRRLGASHQVLGLYLITNPHATIYGLYYLPMVIVAEETGLQRATVLKVLQAFADQQYALYDEPSEWCWVQNMAARQLQLTSQPNPRDPRLVGVRRWYERCPNNPFLGPFYDHYHDLFDLDERRDGGRASLPSVVRVPVVANGSLRAASMELFEQWWAHYPKQTGKKAALAEWLAIKPIPDDTFTAKAIHTVERQKLSADWIKEGGQFIPDPERWLKKGRWDDRATELPLISEADAQRATTLTQWTPRHDDE